MFSFSFLSVPKAFQGYSETHELGINTFSWLLLLLAVGQHTPCAYVGSSNSFLFALLFACLPAGYWVNVGLILWIQEGVNQYQLQHMSIRAKHLAVFSLYYWHIICLPKHMLVCTHTYVHTQSGTHTLMHRQHCNLIKHATVESLLVWVWHFHHTTFPAAF